MKDSLNEGRGDYFNLDDGHDIPWMAANKTVSRPRGRGVQSGTVQPVQENENFEGMTGNQIGAMPLRQVGTMSKSGYGADLGMDATNSLGRFDADSDTMDERLEPRPGGVNVRF